MASFGKDLKHMHEVSTYTKLRNNTDLSIFAIGKLSAWKTEEDCTIWY